MTSDESAATVSEVRFTRTIIGTMGAPLQHGELDVDDFASQEDNNDAVAGSANDEAFRRLQAEGIEFEVSADPMAYGLGLHSADGLAETN